MAKQKKNKNKRPEKVIKLDEALTDREKIEAAGDAAVKAYEEKLNSEAFIKVENSTKFIAKKIIDLVASFIIVLLLVTLATTISVNSASIALKEVGMLSDSVVIAVSTSMSMSVCWYLIDRLKLFSIISRVTAKVIKPRKRNEDKN